MITADFQVVHAGQMLCISKGDAPPQPRRGKALSELRIIEDGALAARDGEIVWVGRTDRIDREVRLSSDGHIIDAANRVVTPGLVDPHTHPVYAAPRHLEFEMRALGKSYQEIAAAGGGIKTSVAATRAATLDHLISMGMQSADRMLRHGTTTAEAKSGYGLSRDAEVKLLEAIAAVNERHAIDWVPTLLAAHEFPPEYDGRPDDYVTSIIEEIMPYVAKRNLAEFNDVFMETGVFNRSQTERIQTRARELGFGLKFHVDEFTDLGGAGLAAEMGAASADHLEYISPEGIAALAGCATLAVLLPGTAYFVDVPKRPPVRRMIDSGVTVALATDCNPGSNMTESMPMAMNQACVMYKMSPAEALVASTWNAACAIRRADRIGALTPERQCDLVVWDVSDYREIAYHYGISMIEATVKNGRPIA